MTNKLVKIAMAPISGPAELCWNVVDKMCEFNDNNPPQNLKKSAIREVLMMGTIGGSGILTIAYYSGLSGAISLGIYQAGEYLLK